MLLVESRSLATVVVQPNAFIFLGFPKRLGEQFHLTFCSHLFLLILFCHGYDVFVIIAYSQEHQEPWSRLWI